MDLLYAFASVELICHCKCNIATFCSQLLTTVELLAWMWELKMFRSDLPFRWIAVGPLHVEFSPWIWANFVYPCKPDFNFFASPTLYSTLKRQINCYWTATPLLTFMASFLGGSKGVCSRVFTSQAHSPHPRQPYPTWSSPAIFHTLMIYI